MLCLYFLAEELVLQFQVAPTHEWKSTCEYGNFNWDGTGDSLEAIKAEATSTVGDHRNQANLGWIIQWSSNLGLLLTRFSSLTHCLCPVQYPKHPYQPPILTAPNKSTFQTGLSRNSGIRPLSIFPINIFCACIQCETFQTQTTLFTSPSKLKLLIPNNVDAEQSQTIALSLSFEVPSCHLRCNHAIWGAIIASVCPRGGWGLTPNACTGSSWIRHSVQCSAGTSTVLHKGLDPQCKHYCTFALFHYYWLASSSLNQRRAPSCSCTSSTVWQFI